MVLATGFSQNTGTPASAAATMSSGCASVAAAITTPSTPEARSFSGVSTASTPSFSTTGAMAAGTASVTTREVTDGNADSVSAWKAPIRPSPINPILMATPVLMRTERSFPAADYGLIRVDVGDRGVVRRCAFRAAAGACVALAAGTTPADRPGAVHGGHGGLSARPPLPPHDRPQEVAEPALTASRPLRTTRTGRTTSTLKGTSPSAGAVVTLYAGPSLRR